jgi:hypothetical protein
MTRRRAKAAPARGAPADAPRAAAGAPRCAAAAPSGALLFLLHVLLEAIPQHVLACFPASVHPRIEAFYRRFATPTDSPAAAALARWQASRGGDGGGEAWWPSRIKACLGAHGVAALMGLQRVRATRMPARLRSHMRRNRQVTLASACPHPRAQAASSPPAPSATPPS